jgi:hypothetical protein
MALKFTIKGIEVTATSAEEAARLINALSEDTPVRREKPKYQMNGKRAHAVEDRPRFPRLKKRIFSPLRATVDVLQTIKDGGDNGVIADNLMPVLDARHPKGIGARLAKVNEVIRKFGYDTETVYLNPRTSIGRIWFRGPDLDAALEAARKAAAKE